MASVIAEADFVPDRILCSPATRTRQTLAPLLPILPDPHRVSIVDELYGGESGDYQEIIAEHGGSAQRLLVIGHNPDIHVTALRLIKAAEDDKRAMQLAAKFPTGGLAVIDFDVPDWSQIRPKIGRLSAFVRPRDLETDTTGGRDI